MKRQSLRCAFSKTGHRRPGVLQRLFYSSRNESFANPQRECAARPRVASLLPRPWLAAEIETPIPSELKSSRIGWAGGRREGET
jgi:hypothetical protein